MKKAILKTVLCYSSGIILSLVLTQSIYGDVKDSATVAVVDNYKITEQDIQQAMNEMKKEARGKDATEEAVLEGLIRSRLLFEEAKKKGIQDRMDIRKKLDWLIRNLLTQQLLTESIGDLKPVTEADARKLYDENWRGVRYPRRLDLSRVTVEYKSDEAAGPAREYADLLRKRMSELSFLTTNEFFEAVKDLQAPSGVVVKGRDDKNFVISAYKQYQPVVMSVASSLKEGEVGGPLELPQRQYEIFKIIRENEKIEIPFSKVSSDLSMSASDLQYQEKLDKFINELKKSHSVEIIKGGKDTPAK